MEGRGLHCDPVAVIATSACRVMRHRQFAAGVTGTVVRATTGRATPWPVLQRSAGLDAAVGTAGTG